MPDTRPNVLMIVLDQLRYDSVGFGGPNAVCGRVHTPHLDALAARSLWFDNAYTALPTCCPARQCMLAGRRAERFGALWNYDITSQVASLTPALPTWPAAMREAGYRMAYVGKWHVSPQYTPLDFGYQIYRSEEEYGAWRAEHCPECQAQFDWFGSVDPVPTQASRTHVLAQWAIQQMQAFAGQDGPWHVRLDLSEPHLPCTPCAEFAALYDPADMRPWPSFAETFYGKPYVQRQSLYNWGNEARTWEEGWARYTAHYFAVVSQADDAIGRVLAALEATGQSGNTVILFTADHGDMCGSHRMMDKHYVLYDDVTHVPLILYVPGVRPRRVQGFVNNCLDMAPTLLELTGAPAFACEGISLAPLARSEGEEGLRDYALTTLNGQQCGLFSQRMLRTREWKYIWNLTDTDELYDMAGDPWELHNRIRDEALAPLVADMRRRLYALLQKEDPDIVKTEWPRRQLLEGRKL